MFRDVVELYRASGRPPIVGSAFTYDGQPDARLSEAINTCKHVAVHFGHFSEPPEVIRQGHVLFSWMLAANEHARFYDSIASLVEGSPRPGQGAMPTAYYLIDTDYAAGEEPLPANIQKLTKLADLVRSLSEIGHRVATGPADPLTLLFVIPADEKSPPKTIQLSTDITMETLGGSDIELGPLLALTTEVAASQLHVEERRSLFRLAIADILGEASPGSANLTYLTTHWDKVLTKYQYDVDAYISRFSFDKVRKEISQAEVDFVTKIHTVVGESSSKLLGLPLSLVAVIGVYHASSLVESILLTLGALLIALLFSGFTENQRLQLGRIDHAFKTVFESIDKKTAQLPVAIQDRLEEVAGAFRTQLRFSRRTLCCVRILAWVPAALATAGTALKFNEGVRSHAIAWISRLLF